MHIYIYMYLHMGDMGGLTSSEFGSRLCSGCVGLLRLAIVILLLVVAEYRGLNN